jgi:hypothetical protein
VRPSRVKYHLHAKLVDDNHDIVGDKNTRRVIRLPVKPSEHEVFVCLKRDGDGWVHGWRESGFHSHSIEGGYELFYKGNHIFDLLRA